MIRFFIILVTVVALVSSAKRRPVKSYSELHNCDLGEELRQEIASYDSVVRDIIDYTFSGPFKGRVYNEFENVQCVLEKILREEIAAYQPVVDRIIGYVKHGSFKERTYSELASFVDIHGARMAGSAVLEQSIDYMINITRAEDINDITTEQVKVPKWLRGQESVVMLEPRPKNISVLGLGYSISTPPGGITAEAVAVKTFQELEELDDAVVTGKIVVYTEAYTTYGDTVIYRSSGASKAAAKGAVAALVKSITPFSTYLPHTGMQTYADNVTQIPVAAITLEDADFIARLTAKGEKVVLKVEMYSSLEYKESRNTIIDVKGKEQPDKMVIVSGHIDSWDVGQGAMDDGGGMMISWAVPVILKELRLRPRRTIRSIFWTAEEVGLIGAAAYEERHRTNHSNINFIMESDEGTFKPLGLVVAGTQRARCIVAEVLKLFSEINATSLVESDSPGSDIVTIVSKGVPGASLLNANEKYFWFHHTEADTMNVEDPVELDLCAGFWTAVAYVIADLSVEIPRV